MYGAIFLNFYPGKPHKLSPSHALVASAVHKPNVSVTGSDWPAAGNGTRCSRTGKRSQTEGAIDSGRELSGRSVSSGTRTHLIKVITTQFEIRTNLKGFTVS